MSAGEGNSTSLSDQRTLLEFYILFEIWLLRKQSVAIKVGKSDDEHDDGRKQRNRMGSDITLPYLKLFCLTNQPIYSSMHAPFHLRRFSFPFSFFLSFLKKKKKPSSNIPFFPLARSQRCYSNPSIQNLLFPIRPPISGLLYIPHDRDITPSSHFRFALYPS